MRKYIYLFSLVILFVISAGCSSDENNSDSNNENPNGIKPTSYRVTESDGDDWRLNFEYNENLISKITTDYGVTVSYNYDDGQLTGYTISNNGQTETINLTYEDGRLIESRSDDNSEIVTFTYNSANQVIKTESIDNEFTTTTFYEYDTAGNVIQAEDEFSTFRFLYDGRNNAFRNVFPQLDAEVQWEWFGSQINNQIQVQQKAPDESTYSIEYTYEYDFNGDNYPTQRRQIRPDGTLEETVDYTY